MKRFIFLLTVGLSSSFVFAADPLVQTDPVNPKDKNLPFKAGVQGQAACVTCLEEDNRVRSGTLKEHAEEIQKATTPPVRIHGSQFLADVQTAAKNPEAVLGMLRKSRGLVQMPMTANGRSICGSYYHRKSKPIGETAYAQPLTACALASLAQDWKKEFCPDENAGCRLTFGDISHATKRQLQPGSRGGHRNGDCFDIRPMRKGAFEDHPLSSSSADYDREKMRQFEKLLEEKGAQKILFYDSIKGRKKGAKDNVLFACFPPASKKVQETCAQFIPDLNACPELK